MVVIPKGGLFGFSLKVGMYREDKLASAEDWSKSIAAAEGQTHGSLWLL
jgi:hypothetical protein